MANSGRGRKRKGDTTPDKTHIDENQNHVVKKIKSIQVKHRCHSIKEGRVLTLGEGDTGQIGLGLDILDRSKPAIVDLQADFIQVCAGGMHTVCLDSAGKIFTFGCNDEGALGRVTKEDGSDYSPGPVELDDRICMVTAGDSHTAALSTSGQVYIWGTFRDVNGAIGLKQPGKIETLPVKHFEAYTIVKISSGVDHLVCLTEDGEVMTIGNAEQGQLGRVAECFSYRGGRKGATMLLAPQVVHFKKKKERFDDIWTGHYVTFVRSRVSGEIFCWGLNNYNQLGFKDQNTRFMPELSKSFESNKDWKEIIGGQHHTVALDGEGKVYTLGRKEYGRLGHGEDDLEDKLEPSQVEPLSSKISTNIACGTATSFAVTDSGEIYAWGMGTSRQLSQKEEDDLFEPTVMTGKQLENRIGIMVSAGGQHTVLLVKDR